MLIDVKVKVARTIDGKTRKKGENFILDKELFAEAELAVVENLSADTTVEDYDIQSLRLSAIKEIATQFDGDFSFIVTLKDIFLEDDGTEKPLKYKVLLWADTPSDALNNALQLAKQGYDMQIEGIKQVDYEYLTNTVNAADTTESTDNGE